MPHKKAIRSVREREKALRTTDLAPKISIDREPIPKSVSRVLDAGRIRREYREKKRQFDGANDEDNPQRKKRRHGAIDKKDEAEAKALKIKPGETVAQFNRRVENTMTPLVKRALRQSSAQTRKVRKEGASQEMLKQSKEGDGKGRRPPPEISKKSSDPLPIAPSSDQHAVTPRDTTKEFQVFSTSTPRRLNDIALQPPDIKKLPRGAKKNDGAPPGVLSMVQKVMMEEEREKVIKHYRELKARKLRVANIGVKVDG